MKKLSFVKTAIIVCLLCLAGCITTLDGFSQDTIYTRKVMIANAQLSRKTGKIQRIWYKKLTVKSGYIIKQTNGLFLINGKEMVPDNFSYTPEKWVANSDKSKNHK